MGQYMRYFADAALALDVLKRQLSASDPTFKIDGGEVSRDGAVLAEIEINKPGSDMFSDDIAAMLSNLQHVGATEVEQRVRRTQAILSVQLLDANAMELLGSFWDVLARLSSGLWHVENQGMYDQGQLVARV